MQLPKTSSACKVQRVRPAVLSGRPAVQSPSFFRPTQASATAKDDADKPLDLKKLNKLVADAVQFDVGDVEKVSKELLDTIVREVASGQKIQLRGIHIHLLCLNMTACALRGIVLRAWQQLRP